MHDDVARVRAGYDRDPEREWGRLAGGAQARLEYLVTRHVLARHLPPPDRPLHLLDAGGGPGRYTLLLAGQGYRMTLLDLSPALLDVARARIAAADPATRERIVAVVEGSITALGGFGDAQFAAILCLGGPLSHLPDLAARRRALGEFRRVLRPGGLLFAGVFNRLGGFRSVVQWPDSWDRFFPSLLRDGLTAMGPGAIPAYTFLPEEFVGEVRDAGFRVASLYGCQGLGAHLQEEHLVALMAGRERWAAWQRVLLDTCDHPNIVGVSSHLLVVASREGAD